MDHKKIRRIDDWVVVQYLGSGAYAHAYEVSSKERSGNQPALVLKWMAENPGDKDASERFSNERAILQKIDHESIPKFYGSGEFENRPYIVMGKAPGKVLKDILSIRQSEGAGAAIGELRVVSILKKILQTLEYLHSIGIHHRDLKDDNILTNESDTIVTIIDFGVCEASAHIQDMNTFRGGVGSARYCPPSKINLEKSIPSHDVFAVGVIGYLLLTNHYPWEVKPTDNIQVLCRLMQERQPIPVHELNNRVSKEVSMLVNQLLNIDDVYRPSAADALRILHGVEQGFTRNVSKKVIQSSKIICPHVTLDPVHKDLRLTDYERSIINCKEFQRLRYLKQLGFTYLVYTGAEHSRFSHALGTMHIASKILSSIEERGDTSFSNDEKLLVRCYALVHDITHIAFGHTLEDELGFFPRHDNNRDRLQRIVLDESSQIGACLRSTDYGQEVLKYMDSGTFSRPYEWVKELVEAPFGADVLDYIDRDSFYCGLDHRVDGAIFRRLSVKPRSQSNATDRHFLTKLHGSHGFRIDAEFSIESVLRERFALFMKVYSHPTKIAASAMLGKVLSNLLTGGTRRNGQRIHAALESLGDINLLHYLTEYKSDIVSSIALMIYHRQLYVPVYRSRLVTSMRDDNIHTIYEARKRHYKDIGLFDHERRTELEEKLAKSTGIPQQDIIVYCSPQAPGIKKVSYFTENERGVDYVNDASSMHIEYMRKHIGLWHLYVFINPYTQVNLRKKLAYQAEIAFSSSNEIDIPIREPQLRLF
jgi:HD superfamily phosphohydrolase